MRLVFTLNDEEFSETVETDFAPPVGSAVFILPRTGGADPLLQGVVAEVSEVHYRLQGKITPTDQAKATVFVELIPADT